MHVRPIAIPTTVFRCASALASIAALAATAPALAQSRDRAPGAASEPSPPASGPDEPVGNRVAQARSELDQLHFQQAVDLLAPLRDRTDVPPEVGVEAGLLETVALVALRRPEQAVEACRRAVAHAGYDPSVAREQSPPVQQVCATAAEEERRSLIERRRLRITETAVQTDVVAWRPVRIEVGFGGELSRLTTQAEVSVNGAAPTLVGLASSGGSTRVVLLDPNLASPGARIRAVPLVRDAFGVLLRGEPAAAIVPRHEAAVRFALGSDEGPLRIDGAPAAASARVGTMLPLPPGRHDLEVRTPTGTARARLSLRRGEVALLTLRTTPGAGARDVLKWSTAGLGVVAAGTGVAFALLAASNAVQLDTLSRQTDPNSQLPTVQYSNVVGLEESRQTFVTAAAGLFVAAGVSIAVASALWLWPGASRETAPGAARASRRSATRLQW